MLSTLTTEIWREIPGYSGMYEVSDRGRVRSWCNNRYGRLKDPRILRAAPRSGTVHYLVVSPQREGRQKTFYAHSLVGNAFLPPKPGPKYEIGHKDGDHLNNDVSNLRWVTRKENSDDKWDHGTHPRQLFGKHLAR